MQLSFRVAPKLLDVNARLKKRLLDQVGMAGKPVTVVTACFA
jgi:hypothetical protein